jgi:WD40 repeat protein/serine/threonine protein kinase/Tfp pilus assembly protein PilF
MKNHQGLATANPSADSTARALEEYLAAAEAGTAPPREEFLARHPELAEDLDACLAALRFIGRAADGPRSVVAEVAGVQAPEQSPGQLGDFRILREVGRGGMGVVYEAEQVSLGRRVALKVLPFAATLDSRHLQRFQNEARAAASLDHPHIVHVHAVGCERGVHYYAMQFIDGQTLAALIADLRQRGGRRVLPEAQPTTPHTPEPLAPESHPEDTAPQAAASTERTPLDRAHFRRVAELGIQAAEALDHAHTLGIVHRDIKPANLLVDARGGLWVADFGLAHIQSDSRLTMTGDLIGTLRYMSPEQALAKRVVVDHRTDVYSLGATLYELLTLEPAFSGTDRQELLRQIAFEEPKAPRRVDKAIPSELETIVLKALEKNPAERYATAKELAEDLRRWLGDEPIRARPAGLVRRLRKWGRRHQAIVGSAFAAVGVVTVVLAISSGLIFAAYKEKEDQRVVAVQEMDRANQEKGRADDRERDAKKAAQQAKDAAEAATNKGKEAIKAKAQADDECDAAYQNLYLAHMQLAQRAWEDGNGERLRTLLDTYLPRPRRKDLRAWEWYYLDALSHRALLTIQAAPPDRKSFTAAVAWGPDGKTLASVGWDDTLKIWDATSGERRAEWRLPVDKLTSVAASPDGKRFAVAGYRIRRQQEDGRTVVRRERPVVILDAATGAILREFPVPPFPANAIVFLSIRTLLAWSPDGRRLATANVSGDAAIRIWDTQGDDRPRTLETPLEPRFQNEKGILGLSWSPDGRRLASREQHRKITVWDAETDKVVSTIPPKVVDNGIGLAWSADARHLIAGYDSGLKILDAASGKEVNSLAITNTDFAVSPDGNHLACTLKVGSPTIAIINLTTFQMEARLGPPAWPSGSLFWSPDGLRLASLNAENQIHVWDPYQDRQYRFLRVPGGNPHSIAWTRKGQQFVTVSHEGEKSNRCAIRFWDASTGKHTNSCTFDLAGPGLFRRGDQFLSPDRRRIVGQETNGERRYQIAVWDTATGRKCFDLGPETDLDLRTAAWSPDNKRLAVGIGNKVQIYEMDKGQAIRSMDLERPVTWLSWDRDGRHLDSISSDSTYPVGTEPKCVVRVWDVDNGKEIRSWSIGISPLKYGIQAASLSPDGRSVALVPHRGNLRETVGATRDIRICDMATGTTRRILSGHTDSVLLVTWSPDGRRLASSSIDSNLKIWDVTSGEPVYSFPFSLFGSGQLLSWSPDGKTLACVARQETGGAIALWDAGKRGRWYPSDAAARSDRALSLATRPEPWLHDPERAIQFAKQATELAPQDARSWMSLGIALSRGGEVVAAAAAYRKAIEVEPDSPEAHLDLGLVLQHMGQFAEALTSLRRGRELGSNNGKWSNAALAAKWVKECEHLIELDGKLSGILSGKQQPANAAERVEYAQLCYYKRLYAAATRLYRDALDAQRDLPAAQLNDVRYDAVCAAARAGEDAKLTDAERASQRKQALDWLRADLDLWNSLLKKEPDKTRTEVARRIQHWLRDRDLNGVRGPDALDKLPEAERKDWQKLWADVADTLKRAKAKRTVPPQKLAPAEAPKRE